MVQNYYNVLGINKNASESEIKRAYKQLAKKYHPDYNKNQNSQVKFIELQKAYKDALNPKIEGSYANIFGLEIWENLVKEEDFNIKGFTIEDVFGEPESEEYKKYKWARNKIKLLNKLYEKMIIYKDPIEDIIGFEIIITHFNKVLTKDINPQEKITKPEDMIIKPIKIIRQFKGENIPEYYDFEIKRIKKLVFDIQNQFHPKFLNKLPMRIQIFIHNKMRNLIEQLNKTNEVI